MGNFCGTDLYEELLRHNRKQFCDYIVAEKLKDTLSLEISDSKTQLSDQADMMRKKMLEALEERQTKIQAVYKQQVIKLESSVQGGIKALEASHGKPVEQLLELSEVKIQFQDARTKVSSEIRSSVTEGFKEIEKTRVELHDDLLDKQPTISQYEQLSVAQKQIIFRKGVKQFAEQIRTQSLKFTKMVNSKCSPDRFLLKPNDLVLLQGIDGLVEIRCSQIKSITKRLLNESATPGYVEGH